MKSSAYSKITIPTGSKLSFFVSQNLVWGKMKNSQGVHTWLRSLPLPRYFLNPLQSVSVLTRNEEWFPRDWASHLPDAVWSIKLKLKCPKRWLHKAGSVSSRCLIQPVSWRSPSAWVSLLLPRLWVRYNNLTVKYSHWYEQVYSFRLVATHTVCFLVCLMWL